METVSTLRFRKSIENGMTPLDGAEVHANESLGASIKASGKAGYIMIMIKLNRTTLGQPVRKSLPKSYRLPATFIPKRVEVLSRGVGSRRLASI